jgi:hypothetical protein
VAMASRRFLPGIDSRVCFACFVPACTSVFATRLAIPATIRLVGRRLSERQRMILVVHVRQLSRDDHEEENSACDRVSHPRTQSCIEEMQVPESSRPESEVFWTCSACGILAVKLEKWIDGGEGWS